MGIEAEKWYTTGTGQLITGVHDPALCEGRPCTIHHPSGHHMRDWPTHWRGDGPFDIWHGMERICPHGVGHPDPDGLDPDRIHGCDGCCSRENTK